ncbi:TPA: transcriptional regulator [Klebsiella pneumoniae]|uniref:transcriptional regulator n=1 Tax=Klebsiella pneumoniae TaxID=573 RepID=UPI000E2F8F2F|nr:transcriptional regulator [Klebsiella pneumoniae]HBR1366631.1 transcriptional regulator [Klebsiella pneumoniae]HBR2015042.1 transcriptional regulator [Klebsiella pneumoniae]
MKALENRNYGIKIKEIKEAEQLTDRDLAELLGIDLGDLQDCEDGRLISLTIISRLTHSDKCMKYALWIMTDNILPATGQISPAIARYGPGRTKSQHSGQKTGKPFTLIIRMRTKLNTLIL